MPKTPGVDELNPEPQTRSYFVTCRRCLSCYFSGLGVWLSGDGSSGLRGIDLPIDLRLRDGVGTVAILAQ